MKINRILVYQVDLPLHEGSYNWSGGHSVQVFDSTLVEIETSGGLVGVGEACPLGSAYLPSYATGVRAGIAEIGQNLIGQNPLALDVLNRNMDQWLKGHPYVKTALEMACWDILGKACEQPLYTLLGGADGEDVGLYRAISQQSPEQMAEKAEGYRAEGYRRFQLKVGADPDGDIERIHAVAEQLQGGDVLIADANTGWLPHQAMRVVRAVKDIDVYIEQPCKTYEECLAIRRHTDLPFILDESLDSMAALNRAIADSAMDVANIKISKMGGLGRSRLARDLLCTRGIGLTIEDTWGGDVTTAAIAHLALSTAAQNRFTATDFNSYVTVSTAEGAPVRDLGRMAPGKGAGLGVRLRGEVIGEPVMEFSAT